METNNKTDKSLWLALATAVAASLCCLTPVLGILAGIGGIASTFSWLDPARPYLIAATAAVLSFAWYKKLRPAKANEIDCACETDERQAFWHSKAFLGIVTVIAALLVTFPYYSGVFFKTASAPIIVEKENIAMATISIQGMTCSGCEQSINKALRDKPGVLESKADHKQGLAWVKYDKSRASFADFRDAVEKTVGYRVIDIKEGT